MQNRARKVNRRSQAKEEQGSVMRSTGEAASSRMSLRSSSREDDATASPPRVAYAGKTDRRDADAPSL